MAKMEQQVRKALKLLSQSDVVDQADLGQAGIGDKTIAELVKQGCVSLGSSPSGIALYSITDTGLKKAADPVPEKRKARSGLPKTAISATGIDTRRGKTGQAVYLSIMEPLAEALSQAPTHDAITLCANSHGKPWTYNGFSTNWAKIKGKLEREGKVQPGLTLKGLRHTVASILREMGKDYGTIQLVLGHATEAMARHYSRRADMTRQATATVTDFEAEMNKRKTNVVKPGD